MGLSHKDGLFVFSIFGKNIQGNINFCRSIYIKLLYSLDIAQIGAEVKMY